MAIVDKKKKISDHGLDYEEHKTANGESESELGKVL